MKLHVTFTRCQARLPLMELDNQPFNGLEIRPAALRSLGLTLMWLADLGSALPTDGRDWKPARVELDIDSAQDPAVQFAVQVAAEFNKTSQTTEMPCRTT